MSEGAAQVKTPRTDEQQHWGEAVVECVSDNAERERLIRFYDYEELVQACLALGSLALTAKNEYARAEKLQLELARKDALLREWHDRLGSMIDQVGHPDYSLREMVEGMRKIRDEMIERELGGKDG